MRSMGALARAHARQQRREAVALVRALKEAEKEEEKREAATEVAIFDATIAALASVHKECAAAMDWNKVRECPAPAAPKRPDTELAARAALESYRPGFFARLFGAATKKRTALEAAIEAARRNDAEAHKRLLREYHEDRQQWDQLTSLARRIVDGDAQAMAAAFDALDSFDELVALGLEVRPRVVAGRNDALEIGVLVEEKQVVPATVKSLTKTGKVSERPMPKTRSAEIYQDYVCGAALRVAREVFAAVPVRFALINCSATLLDESTGLERKRPILSLIAPRATVDDLRFETLDPSQAVTKMIHKMSFKRGEGMRPIESLGATEIPA